MRIYSGLFEKNKPLGSIIKLTWFPRDSGFIWIDYANKATGNNGLHMDILYKDKVYYNVHPYGLPKQQWIDNFNCPPSETKLPLIEISF